MPVVLRPGPYRLYFYSHEPNEAPHVQIDRNNQSCKFWLQPLSVRTEKKSKTGMMSIDL
jgi:hypothetical protein